MKLDQEMIALANKARVASTTIYSAPIKIRNQALLTTAQLLKKETKSLLAANRKDLEQAEKSGLSTAMLDRLTMTKKGILGMASAMSSLAAQDDPVGHIDLEKKRSDGLLIQKVRVPLGVILIIYESRPNVTIDSAALCIKSGNAVILRGGKEAIYSNTALAALFKKALKSSGLPESTIQLVKTTDRKAIDILLQQSALIDLVIPRGGESLIKAVTEQSKIPVLKHYKGVCHLFIEKNADLAMAKAILQNAKLQRPGTCNAAETLLIDKALPKRAQLELLETLHQNGVILFGCPESRKLLPAIQKADGTTYYQEYLDLRMSVKIVAGLSESIAHIRKFGSGHTEAIVTQNKIQAHRFLEQVDSSSVMWNASTRLADGGEYLLGAEIGISTDKLHARGPMGAYDLTSYKWVVIGNGHLRK